MTKVARIDAAVCVCVYVFFFLFYLYIKIIFIEMRYRCRSNRSMYDARMPRLCHTMHKIFFTLSCVFLSFVSFLYLSHIQFHLISDLSISREREEETKKNCIQITVRHAHSIIMLI